MKYVNKIALDCNPHSNYKGDISTKAKLALAFVVKMYFLKLNTNDYWEDIAAITFFLGSEVFDITETYTKTDIINPRV